MKNRIALGLTDYLTGFAKTHEATTYRTWSRGVPDWRVPFMELASSDDTEIFWNMQGVNVGYGLLNAASCGGSRTGWELKQFRDHPMWLPRTFWFDEIGKTIPVPTLVQPPGALAA